METNKMTARLLRSGASVTGFSWPRIRFPAIGLRLLFAARFRPGATLGIAGVSALLLAGSATLTEGFSQSTNRLLTKLSEVQSLSLDEGSKGYPVSVRASVTYCDADWKMLFVQDETGSAYVSRAKLDGAKWDLRAGQVVLLNGVTSPGITQCNVRESDLKVTEAIEMPMAVALDDEAAFRSTSDARWVKTTGFITGTSWQIGNKTDLRLCVGGGRTLRLVVLDGDLVRAKALLGYMVEVSGVYGLDLTTDRKPSGTNVLWVPDFAWVRKVQPIPITAIASLTAPAAPHSVGLPSRIRGTVMSEQAAKFIFVRDGSGSVRANFEAPVSPADGSPVEIVGLPEKQDGVLVLNQSVILTANESANPAPAATEMVIPTAANTNLDELTRVVQVRNLSLAEALRGHPVHITGVLTYSDPGQMQFVQDNSGGIFVDLKRKKFAILPAARQRVEIRGFSGPGDFAPVVEAEQVRALGEGDFPAPNPSAIQTLMTGSQDSQWVTVNGVIRNQTLADGDTVLSLSAGDSLVSVTVPDAINHPAPANYEDALVEIQGVCATSFDDQRRLKGIMFYVPGWEQVQVLDAAPRDAFALHLRPLSDLLRFQAAGGGVHRSHVHGVVSLCREDGAFYLQDGTGGVLVQPQAGMAPVKTGDEIELVGFPSVRDNLPVLQEAVIKPAGHLAKAVPFALASDAPVKENLNGTLVHLEGQAVAHFTSTAQEWLSVQFGQWITDAVLDKNQPGDQLAKVLPGSMVSLTGVYVPRLDDNQRLQSFQVLLRSPKDVTVISRPTWWTAGHTFWVLGTFGVVLALALTWVSLLRNQVQIQTHQLREEIEERKRIEAQMELTHQELVTASRQAGMAEVATSVLHNVGNVLNSVNVSSNLLVEHFQRSRTLQVARVADTLREHAGDLGEYLTRDPKGRLLVSYVGQLAEHLSGERAETLKELESLTGNIEHIKDIVMRQQQYGKSMGGVRESLAVPHAVEDALRVHAGAFDHQVKLVRDYQEGLPKITTDKHKVLQILINLVGNAKYACVESRQPDPQVVVRVRAEAGWIKIMVVDNGVGILPENLTRIFNYGFTTRQHGHGLGLHSSALAARELRGNLAVHSAGPGQGATFTLELPLDSAAAESAHH
jgi:signal transduction histidine kinase